MIVRVLFASLILISLRVDCIRPQPRADREDKVVGWSEK